MSSRRLANSLFRKAETTRASPAQSGRNSTAARGPAASILGLQCALGNAATGRLLAGALAQPKLTVSRPGDRYEQEADRVADDVMRMPEPGPVGVDGSAPRSIVQRLCTSCEEEQAGTSREGTLQRQPADEEKQTVQTKPAVRGPAIGSTDSTAGEASVGATQRGSGRPVDTATRAFMEPRFGRDFGDVRLHDDADAARSARAIGAQAYTAGGNIVFGAGRYAPQQTGGRRLLAHELAHVVQQGRAGAAPAVQREAETPDAEKKKEEEEEPGFFGRAWKGLKSVGKAVWSGPELVGKGIAAGAQAVWTGVTWVAGQLWDKVVGVFGRLINWIVRLPERVGRLLMGLWEGVKSLRPWSLEWWKSLGSASTWRGLLKWLGVRLIDLLEIAGIGEIYETVADFIKFNTRALTGAEEAKATEVFGDVIDYHLVRVDEGAILGPAFSDRPYTSFHTINSWGPLSDDVLMHELTHVVQYQRLGAVYMPMALHAQGTKEGYDYGGVAALTAAQAAGQPMTGFNLEQQAQIVEDYYRLKHGQPPHQAPEATAADLPLFAHFVAQVSSRTVADLSR